jgi:Protein of unknown function (DUF4079)
MKVCIIGRLFCVSSLILPFTSHLVLGFAPPSTTICRGTAKFPGKDLRLSSTTSLAVSPFDHDFIQLSSSILTSSSSLLDTMNPPELSTMTIAEGIRDVAIFKGKTLSLLHPVMMFGMLGFSLSTALLGFQWRRQRTLGDEIRKLQASLPSTKSSEGDVAVDTGITPQAAAIQSQIDAFVAERKQLASEGPRDKHFSQGATLAFLGTLFAIEVRAQYKLNTTDL